MVWSILITEGLTELILFVKEDETSCLKIYLDDKRKTVFVIENYCFVNFLAIQLI